MYLEEYARQHGMRNIRHFSDDGYSGTNFNRPGFNALLEEIEAGHVAVLIVKDLSRFGRNYLQVGYYTEVVFPKKGIRFIAINNSVDSANPSDNSYTEYLLDSFLDGSPEERWELVAQQGKEVMKLEQRIAEWAAAGTLHRGTGQKQPGTDRER